MHPIIRITGFLILTAFLSHGSVNTLLVCLLALACFYLLNSELEMARARQMLYRLRWLFVSLLTIYLLFTPGQPLFEGAWHWLPTYEGLAQGGYRVSSLIVIIMAVSFLLQSTDKIQLVASVRRLLTPFSLVGLSVERLAARMVLTMDKIADTQSIMQASVQSCERPVKNLRGYFSSIGHISANVFEQVVARAEQEEEETLELIDDAYPPVLQWSYPIAFGVLLWVVK